MFFRNYHRQALKRQIESGRAILRTIGIATALACLTLVSSVVLWARQHAVRPPKPPRPPQNQAWRRARIRQDAHRHAPGFFQRLRDLPPDQQDRILENDAQFHQLPPWRQQQIRQNLARWNNLAPHQKEVLRQREEIVQSLPPEKRQELKNVFPKYRQLPPGQQQQVMQAFRRLESMPPGQRQRFLASPAFEQRFTPRQQDVLRGLNDLLPR